MAEVRCRIASNTDSFVEAVCTVLRASAALLNETTIDDVSLREILRWASLGAHPIIVECIPVTGQTVGHIGTGVAVGQVHTAKYASLQPRHEHIARLTVLQASIADRVSKSGVALTASIHVVVVRLACEALVWGRTGQAVARACAQIELYRVDCKGDVSRKT